MMLDPGPNENTAPDADRFWFVTVEIPRTATAAEANRIFDAVADAAYDAEPEDCNWDVFIHGVCPHPDDFPGGHV